jgi:hypothetical protein
MNTLVILSLALLPMLLTKSLVNCEPMSFVETVKIAESFDFLQH